MEAIYRSRHGDIFTSPLEALYDDAEMSAFTMYDKSGEVTADLNECRFVLIENQKGIDDFDKFREDWRRWMDMSMKAYLYGMNVKGIGLTRFRVAPSPQLPRIFRIKGRIISKVYLLVIE